jgi:hypothetical protein
VVIENIMAIYGEYDYEHHECWWRGAAFLNPDTAVIDLARC